MTGEQLQPPFLLTVIPAQAGTHPGRLPTGGHGKRRMDARLHGYDGEAVRANRLTRAAKS